MTDWDESAYLQKRSHMVDDWHAIIDNEQPVDMVAHSGFNQLPGNVYLNGRQVPVSGFIAAYLPLHEGVEADSFVTFWAFQSGEWKQSTYRGVVKWSSLD